jgi:hypothetical protein
MFPVHRCTECDKVAIEFTLFHAPQGVIIYPSCRYHAWMEIFDYPQYFEPGSKLSYRLSRGEYEAMLVLLA